MKVIANVRHGRGGQPGLQIPEETPRVRAKQQGKLSPGPSTAPQVLCLLDEVDSLVDDGDAQPFLQAILEQVQGAQSLVGVVEQVPGLDQVGRLFPAAPRFTVVSVGVGAAVGVSRDRGSTPRRYGAEERRPVDLVSGSVIVGDIIGIVYLRFAARTKDIIRTATSKSQRSTALR